MMRRLLALCLLLFAAPDPSWAQGEKVYRIGVLSAALPRNASTYTGFEQRPRELGYIVAAIRVRLGRSFPAALVPFRTDGPGGRA